MTQKQIDELAEMAIHNSAYFVKVGSPEWNFSIEMFKAGYAAAPAYKGDDAKPLQEKEAVDSDAVTFLRWVDRGYKKERKGYVLRKVYANNPNLDNVKYWQHEELYNLFKQQGL